MLDAYSVTIFHISFTKLEMTNFHAFNGCYTIWVVTINGPLHTGLVTKVVQVDSNNKCTSEAHIYMYVRAGTGGDWVAVRGKYQLWASLDQCSYIQYRLLQMVLLVVNVRISPSDPGILLSGVTHSLLVNNWICYIACLNPNDSTWTIYWLPECDHNINHILTLLSTR